MSVQFGRWNLDGEPVNSAYLQKAESLIAQYGPDGGRSYATMGATILYRSFQTTEESLRELQPHITESGIVITWDGRLDNRAELVSHLRDVVTNRSTDVSIVAAAYERWSTACFAKLVGDWALSIFEPRSRSLILAKDPIGTRHLYYSLEKDHLTWSTILDPLVLLANRALSLSEEYIAGWFSLLPAVHLTPYAEIQSVPPSSFVIMQPGKHAVREYWDFDPTKKLRYHKDAEYEEHFRTAFRESVRRRLRAHTPVLAELSGGMDSSSIVCMADKLIEEGRGDTPRLDTLSYYDDAEPNWNERPYFAMIEKGRGRTGCHIDLETHALLQYAHNQFVPAPGAGPDASERAKHFAKCLESQNNRVVLSGIGGDEVTGGVPTPIPELADLLARGRLLSLRKQVIAWALAKRMPVVHLLAETLKAFLPVALLGVSQFRPAPSWLQPAFIRRNYAAVHGYESRTKLLSGLPSFQGSLSTFEVLRRQLGCSAPSSSLLFEKRYPFLDRDLLEFLFAIPREQLLRPGQRRSLMRRALTGIVPDEILNRKRKAFVTRAILASLSADWCSMFELTRDMVSSSIGVVDASGFCEVMQQARHGKDIPLVPLLHTLSIEYWFRHLTHWGFQPLTTATKSVRNHRRVQLASCESNANTERR